LSGEELAGWLGRASIYALPARYEPFGLSALEAALSGCALVLGEIPSLREVWGDAACYAPPGDTAALEETLLELIRNEALRREIASRAGRRALAYAPERMAQGYVAEYRALTPARESRAAR
jgi:glycosyltransferase involved in cell wall biosynthesis